MYCSLFILMSFFTIWALKNLLLKERASEWGKTWRRAHGRSRIREVEESVAILDREFVAEEKECIPQNTIVAVLEKWGASKQGEETTV
jgi:hypothetical protein